ncbi:SGNH/GDSL hydrolase family protein [Dietzia sp. UBA5065]|jgi:lysophospholipase L1-like esterase|uniref:SGNH/GDSL hydrolase family protein n=1 Tax=Dietzia sp. UBA5065 TaxID=1946422 RepID=UPI0025BE3BE4|nr:SGNH/GDSL hydrolase family protein [Dietzia sp. UBA5065]
MPTPRRRRTGSRFVPTLALAASACLAAVPLASAQSTAQADGTITVGSLGSTADLPASASGSLGSLAQPAYADYVALGDSYAAFGDQTETLGPASCDRSTTNYASTLDANPAVGDLTDVSCGGARIPDLAAGQAPGIPAQFDALDVGTDLVTLSIGGNDVGFSMIVGCITRQGPFAQLPPTSTCQSQIGGNVELAINAVFGTGGQIDDVYDAIEERSPQAKVIATRYLPLMPAAGGSCAFTDSLNPDDVAWARAVGAAINVAVNIAATRNGHVSVLPTSVDDRSACAPADQRWTDFLGGPPTNAAPFHPTALGQQAMAGAIADAL